MWGLILVDEPKRSKRARVVKDSGSDFVTYNVEDDSVTFKDDMASSEAKQLKEAVKSEMASIVSNGTWVLVDLPSGCTTIGSLALVYNILIHQMDVKTTFLYGELEEEIYMDQPKGFVAHELRYSQIIGSLQYLGNGTRPDISFSISKLARYTSYPNKTQWGAFDSVLRYLKGTVYWLYIMADSLLFLRDIVMLTR
ncbi:Retrovirus-related Pol polyprotein from transposon TNT 1-94 [Sesamum angolense]|uniref:Retrovirus-related Pol polyprotein from transposon TNT 1-94 n=1 Tax=Sesamum angolense TaxID=2727404 RepID=A0AAE1T875_9LAMI|nr:Retrovirus-related Pol polyprotein from transposon TNT 1-94 [Sesamum angolense]